EGYHVVTANNGRDALDKVKAENFNVVITDIKMPGMDGIQLLHGIKKHDPNLPVVIMTAYASQQSAIDAVNLGAFQYLIKNAKNDEIKLVVRNALEMRRVRTENLYLKRELKRGHDEKSIIGSSEEMFRVFKMVDKVADSDATILIQGESGTGKELIAKEIHYRSRRATGPFVSINCGAIPRDLLESNLFGHVKGSFTGAVRDSQGLFQVAEGGTFFLDEVGEMPLATQVKLLRALQEREIIPVGGTQPIKIDCRLVAATNADLVMERAMILDEGGIISPEDLPDKIRFGESHRGSLIIDSPTLTLEELEKEYILKVLNFTRWQKKRTSEILGINASTLYRKLIAYG